ncbi:MAG: peptide-methionine (R)-S-oxide reductase [Candidatus Taylorbacteria bacterium RIFCSPLOWO2_01_FULL_45_15b]|uniref:peptide-methionine (R)-S-oxide reductase n=1 Tax=Candidatus Taylorbacteria bacterium RIFCSPLOWO2_01_FULL_45_15b TaxID=1802319 RepID=A0A1G2N709_9BACT|nr:MAG: peptide-methionine (R)-S-oxide reductase [Candidatus Taylorbacteria bacterium RIFCSPLOWO2_01_FULL_45_15b]
MEKIKKTNEEWKQILPKDVYHVTREKGTEPAFSGEFWDNHEKGQYRCSNCGLQLFSSETKYDSGTGWPSFYKPVDDAHLESRPDNGLLMKRTETICARCGAHLGHVFADGPEPTGRRFCMNSCALTFEADNSDGK